VRSQHLREITFVCVAGAMILSATAGQTQQPPTPPLVKQINNGNWLAQNEAETLRDELFYQRAVHAYMTMLPALNTIGMRNGSEATFGKGYNVLPIWKDRMDSRTWVPTPNADVIYSMSYLDLKETGPLVIAAPANVIMTFLRENDAPIVKNFVIPATSRLTIDVGNAQVPEITDGAFGADIVSDVPIAVERAVYSNANGQFWAAGTNAAATRLP